MAVAAGDSSSLGLKALYGDLDRDRDIDIDDFNLLVDCWTGPDNPPTFRCDGADLDGDTDADLADFAVFQRVFTGS